MVKHVPCKRQRIISKLNMIGKWRNFDGIERNVHQKYQAHEKQYILGGERTARENKNAIGKMGRNQEGKSGIHPERRDPEYCREPMMYINDPSSQKKRILDRVDTQ